MLIRTLTRACGRLNFDVGMEIDMPESDALELIAAGSALNIEPAPVAKSPAKKPKKDSSNGTDKDG